VGRRNVVVGLVFMKSKPIPILLSILLSAVIGLSLISVPVAAPRSHTPPHQKKGMITLTPYTGAVGTVVTASGSGFSPSDTMVTLSNTPAGLGARAATCTVSGGVISPPCSFTVSNTAALGAYTVTATGNVASDSASATFTVAAFTVKH
jgi:hypothetical protein